MELLTLILCFVCFIGGVIYGEFRQTLKIAEKMTLDPEGMIETIRKVQKELKSLKEKENAGLGDDAVEVIIEKHQDMYYIFRADNDQFLGQGLDRDETLKSISAKLGNVNLLAKQIKEVSQTA